MNLYFDVVVSFAKETMETRGESLGATAKLRLHTS